MLFLSIFAVLSRSNQFKTVDKNNIIMHFCLTNIVECTWIRADQYYIQSHVSSFVNQMKDQWKGQDSFENNPWLDLSNDGKERVFTVMCNWKYWLAKLEVFTGHLCFHWLQGVPRSASPTRRTRYMNAQALRLTEQSTTCVVVVDILGCAAAVSKV